MLRQPIDHIGQICGSPGNRTPCGVFGASYVGGPIPQGLMLLLPVQGDEARPNPFECGLVVQTIRMRGQVDKVGIWLIE